VSGKKNKKLVDEAARKRIRTELGKTLLVEAAAGTGKTRSLVDRMMALLKDGLCRVETLVAVTFTRKAAGELRSRFRLEIERELKEVKGDEAERLTLALSNLERCFIGTIHSFCARLLRERPVEAEVNVEFVKIDEELDERIREKAWDEFAAKLYAAGDPLLDELDGLGLNTSDLAGAFVGRFASYPDVRDWPVGEVELPDLGEVARRLQEYVSHMERLIPTFPAERGTDKLMAAYERIARVFGQTPPEQAREVMDLLMRFRIKLKPTQGSWPGGKPQGKEEGRKWKSFCEYVEPIIALWRAKRYGVVIRVLKKAKDIYDRMRDEGGMLNFQDLLMKAGKLLRDRPHVRKYFRKRFTHILVDEFQDTDPIQAEMMLFLAAKDPEETDWTKCAPAPGSLFIVGDPKQSIYRFRRADIVTYNHVKKIIEESGGEVLKLSSNFRTVEPVTDFVNAVFGNEFPEKATDHSPEYVPLVAARPDARAGGPAGVETLAVPAEHTNVDTIARYDAGLIARKIRDLIDSGVVVRRTSDRGAEGERPGVAPGDFMIVTWRKARLNYYADALRKLGIPCRVTGGSTLNEVPELDLFSLCVRAVAEPENPVALVAVLRSGLFGISDAALYAFKRAGGKFNYATPVPDACKGEGPDFIRDAFARLKKYAKWFSSRPMISAAEKTAGDLGLFAMTAAASDSSIAAGSFAKTFELLRAARGEITTVAELADYLEKLAGAGEVHDGLPAREPGEDVVRVMNLHQAKGLEAPFVFLADPSGKSKYPVSLHVDRAEGKIRGYLAIHEPGWGYQPVGDLIACPLNWEDTLENEEREFSVAEEKRLMYVAATRAGMSLTISQRGNGNHRNPWKFFHSYLGDYPDAEDPGKQKAPKIEETVLRIDSVRKAESKIEKQWQDILEPTYEIVSARKRLAGAARAGLPAALEGAEGRGIAWGSAIHALLEARMENPGCDLMPLAESALRENEISISLAKDAVLTVDRAVNSEIWKRAAASGRRFVEIPYQVPLPEGAHKIERGVIDLVFREEKGWVIVDYKTDTVTEESAARHAEEYAPQLAAYAEAWESAVGEPVVETGIYFTGLDMYVKLG
jgi:ATP-dependent helicase/nuclease subunit A